LKCRRTRLNSEVIYSVKDSYLKEKEPILSISRCTYYLLSSRTISTNNTYKGTRYMKRMCSGSHIVDEIQMNEANVIITCKKTVMFVRRVFRRVAFL
jgi:hypothetical protein